MTIVIDSIMYDTVWTYQLPLIPKSAPKSTRQFLSIVNSIHHVGVQVLLDLDPGHWDRQCDSYALPVMAADDLRKIPIRKVVGSLLRDDDGDLGGCSVFGTVTVECG